MRKTTRLLVLTALMISSVGFSGCTAPFIGSLNVGLGTDTPSIAENDSVVASDCPAYNPMPDAVKAFLKAHNETDATLDPWAGWMLNLRLWLEGGCG